MDGTSAASYGSLIGATLLALVGLPLFGVLVGFLQQRWYQARLKAGAISEDDIPFFGILMLRGMLGGFVVLAVLAISANIANPPKVQQPPAATAAP